MTAAADPVKAWCATLGSLLNPATPGIAMEALGTLIPHLRLLSPQAFTAESARRVARADRYGSVPDWGVIERTLIAYLREVTPMPLAISPPRAPDRPPPSDEEQARVLAMISRMNAEIAASREVVELPKLRDVTLKGGTLAKARETGIVRFNQNS